MIASTVGRVSRHTDEFVNRQIEETTKASIHWHAEHPGAINKRLRELDEEWDTERTLEANAATLAFIGTVMGWRGSRNWLLLPATVTAFLLQHAVQGWCPPLAIIRRMGVRTSREIEIERIALKVLRRDFETTGVPDDSNKANDAFFAAKK